MRFRGSEAIYNGRDVFVWLPTGFGKSICFQAPSNSNLFLGNFDGGRHLLVSGETILALLAFVLFSDTCCTNLSKANWEDFASSLKICKYKQLIMIKHRWRIIDTHRPICNGHHIRFQTSILKCVKLAACADHGCIPVHYTLLGLGKSCIVAPITLATTIRHGTSKLASTL